MTLLMLTDPVNDIYKEPDIKTTVPFEKIYASITGKDLEIIMRLSIPAI
ncbi:MAG: hypothetical protein JJE15_08875 [Desulfobacteraceae bacterium]|nr:hypothetical protein [Desulfobacteraceae bacterium]